MRDTATGGAKSGTNSFSTPAAIEQTQRSAGSRAATPGAKRQPSPTSMVASVASSSARL